MGHSLGSGNTGFNGHCIVVRIEANGIQPRSKREICKEDVHDQANETRKIIINNDGELAKAPVGTTSSTHSSRQTLQTYYIVGAI